MLIVARPAGMLRGTVNVAGAATLTATALERGAGSDGTGGSATVDASNNGTVTLGGRDLSGESASQRTRACAGGSERPENKWDGEQHAKENRDSSRDTRPERKQIGARIERVGFVVAHDSPQLAGLQSRRIIHG